MLRQYGGGSGSHGVLRLHYFSNSPSLRLPSIEEEDEVYRPDQIKEFDLVDPAWKTDIAEALDKGSRSGRCWRRRGPRFLRRHAAGTGRAEPRDQPSGRRWGGTGRRAPPHPGDTLT